MIRINVGGTYFDTLEATLVRAGGRLAQLVTAPAVHDPLGFPFLDRDPDNFRTLLNWVRNPEVPLPDTMPSALRVDAEHLEMTSALPWVLHCGAEVELARGGSSRPAEVVARTLKTVTLRDWCGHLVTYSHEAWDGDRTVVHENSTGVVE